MLAMTKGFENKQSVTIYDNEIITNSAMIDMAKEKGEDTPDPTTKVVTYISAGLPQGSSVYDGPLRDKHKREFPETWKAFQEGQDTAGKGIHLSELPREIMSTNLLSEYKSRGIEFVEQLASIDDNSIDAFPKGLKTREAAKRYLALIKDEIVEETADKVNELGEAFKAFKEDSEAEKMALLAKIEELQKNQKAKPGPKPKTE